MLFRNQQKVKQNWFGLETIGHKVSTMTSIPICISDLCGRKSDYPVDAVCNNYTGGLEFSLFLLSLRNGHDGGQQQSEIII